MNNLFFKGTIEICKYENGKLIEKYNTENLITQNGFIYLAKMIGGDVTGGINKIALGNNNTVPAETDSKLYNKLVLIDAKRDYKVEKRIKFFGIVPERTFQTTVYYREIGLVYKTLNEEILITRAVFENAIYQSPNNSLTVGYDLSLVGGI